VVDGTKGFHEEDEKLLKLLKKHKKKRDRPVLTFFNKIDNKDDEKAAK